MPTYEYAQYRISIEADNKEDADKALQAEIDNGNVAPLLEESAVIPTSETTPIPPQGSEGDLGSGQDEDVPPLDETLPLADTDPESKEEDKTEEVNKAPKIPRIPR